MSSKDHSETHRFFPSGDWEGFYLYDRDSQKHVMQFTLNFHNGIVTGVGSDDVGGFSWKGTYNIEAFQCSMTKHYAKHTIFYNGDADDNGIWGRWTHGSNPALDHLTPTLQKIIQEHFRGGGFHIWPKKREASEEAIEAKVEEEVKVKASPVK